MTPNLLPNGSVTAVTLIPSPTSVTGSRRCAEFDKTCIAGLGILRTPQRLLKGCAKKRNAECEHLGVLTCHLTRTIRSDCPRGR